MEKCVYLLLIPDKIAELIFQDNEKKFLITSAEIDYENAAFIDRQARWIFPLAWFIFMMVYYFHLVEIHKTVPTRQSLM